MPRCIYKLINHSKSIEYWVPSAIWKTNANAKTNAECWKHTKNCSMAIGGKQYGAWNGSATFYLHWLNNWANKLAKEQPKYVVVVVLEPQCKWTDRVNYWNAYHKRTDGHCRVCCCRICNCSLYSLVQIITTRCSLNLLDSRYIKSKVSTRCSLLQVQVWSYSLHVITTYLDSCL